jgi:CBS domain-containing protein
MANKDKKASDFANLLQGSQLIYRISAFQYHETMGQIMETDVYTCGPDDPLQDIAGEMARRRISSVIVIDGDLRPVGIVTERDMVRKAVAKDAGHGAGRRISEVMTPDPVCLPKEGTLFDALSIISRYHVKHLPILDRERIAGIVTLRQIMRIRHAEPLVIIGQLDRAETPDDFRHIRENLVDLVKEKLDSNTDPVDIVTMLSLVNAGIHKRLFNKAVRELGKPPADFSLFVTGSLGRNENLLFPDQDFCVIIDDYEERHFNEYDLYFYEISKRLSDALNEAGFPYCPGRVMGQNPLWRKRISEWIAHVSYLFNNPGRYTTRYMTLLFDSQHLYGNAALFERYINHAYLELSRNRNILRQMHQEEEGRHRVPLGWFNKFITEKGDFHKGEIDMKRSGLIFMIESARILAMKHGIREISTLRRIQALAGKNVIHRDDAEYFENAYRVILYHTLKAQTDNVLRKSKDHYYLNPRNLSARDRETLKQAFRAVGNLQDIAGSEFGELIM